MTEPSLSVLLTLFCALSTAFLTEQVRRFLSARAMLDIPNERSSHKIPVPRGGGWALVFVLLPVVSVAAIYCNEAARYAPLLAGMGLLVAISWLDDRRDVSPLLRLCLHLAAATLGSLSLPDRAVLFGGHVPFILDRAAMILGWGWFMNLYNFMDGIDGITGVETASLAIGAAVLLMLAGAMPPFLAVLCCALLGCSVGFLRANWHPAKIFLGDVGSVPLGFLTGFLLLTIAAQGHLIAALCLPLYYLADSGITITKRALRREKIWQAHRQHFYQRAALGLKRHDAVVLRIIAANGGLIAAAVLGFYLPWAGLLTSVLIVALLLIKLHKSALVFAEES